MKLSRKAIKVNRQEDFDNIKDKFGKLIDDKKTNGQECWRQSSKDRHEYGWEYHSESWQLDVEELHD